MPLKFLRFRSVVWAIKRYFSGTPRGGQIGDEPPLKPPTGSQSLITDATIKSAIRNAPTSDKKVTELKDNGSRGEGRLMLLIRVGKNHRITTEWYAVWWSDGRRSMAKMGAYPTMSLADARKSFAADYAPAIAKGDKPVAPRARKSRMGVTVKDLFKSYVDAMRADDKASTDDVERALLTGGKRGAKPAAKAIGDPRGQAAHRRNPRLTSGTTASSISIGASEFLHSLDSSLPLGTSGSGRRASFAVSTARTSYQATVATSAGKRTLPTLRAAVILSPKVAIGSVPEPRAEPANLLLGSVTEPHEERSTIRRSSSTNAIAEGC